MKIYPFLLIFLLCICRNVGYAQETNPEWHFLIEPYLMFPGMKGETTVRQFPAAEVDAEAEDIFSYLKFGMMLYSEATNDNWTISVDLIFMKLEQDAKANPLIQNGKISMNEMALEFAGLKRVATWLDAGVAARILRLTAEIDLETIGDSHNGSSTKTWVDPVIVLRSHGAIQKKWLLQLRGDFGGFGIGSDFTWQIQANVGYRFSRLFQTSVGYRVISIDYDKGNGPDRFLYNINTFGPVLRFGFYL